MMWRYSLESLLVLTPIAVVIGLAFAAYREHRQKKAHKVERFKRIGINYIMREMK